MVWGGGIEEKYQFSVEEIVLSEEECRIVLVVLEMSELKLVLGSAFSGGR